jgi:hypothetical protein
MRTRLFYFLILLTAATSLGASDLWIHVRVIEDDRRPTMVEVNLPLRLVERLAPMINDYQRREAELHVGHHDMNVDDLRRIWSRLQNGETVVEDDAILNLETGERGLQLVVRERHARDGAVVALPADVVEALLSGQRDKPDLEAAVRALASFGEGELVSVRDDGTMVRIWLDRNPEPAD